MVEDGEGGMTTTEFSVFYHCIFIFYRISKRHIKVTEVNLNHQGQTEPKAESSLSVSKSNQINHLAKPKSSCSYSYFRLFFSFLQQMFNQQV